MNGTEWVVTYWAGANGTTKTEKRFRGEERDLAYRYVMRLPDKFRVHIDCVNQGDEVNVK